MALTAYVRAQIFDPQTGVVMVDVLNQETISIPGPGGPFQPQHGELFGAVLERLSDDVKERAAEQARDYTKA